LGVSREPPTHIERHQGDRGVVRGEKASPAFRDIGRYAITPWAKRAREQHQCAAEVIAAWVVVGAPLWPRDFTSEL
jgi:hypothetical protein